MNWLTVTHTGHARPFNSLTAALVWAEATAAKDRQAVEIRGAFTGDVVAVVEPEETREPTPQAGRMGGEDE